MNIRKETAGSRTGRMKRDLEQEIKSKLEYATADLSRAETSTGCATNEVDYSQQLYQQMSPFEKYMWNQGDVDLLLSEYEHRQSFKKTGMYDIVNPDAFRELMRMHIAKLMRKAQAD